MRTVPRRIQQQRAKDRLNVIPAPDPLSKRRDEELRMTILMEFVKLKPPKFEGLSDPVAAKRWLNTIKEMFETARINESYWVGFAIYLFEGLAEDWLELKWNYRAVKRLNWKKFEKLFRETYTPDCKYGQDHMTVADYYPRFLEVSHLDRVLMADPVLRCDKFRSTLRYHIRSKLARFTFTGIDELFDAARKVEADLEKNGRARKQLKELEKYDRVRKRRKELQKLMEKDRADKPSPVAADEHLRSISSSPSGSGPFTLFSHPSAKLHSDGDVEGQLRGQSGSRFTATQSSVTRTQFVGLLYQNASSCNAAT